MVSPACSGAFRRMSAEARTQHRLPSKKPQAFARLGLFRRGETGKPYLLVRVPTTSTSTRRFLARPSLVPLSATGWPSPLPSV